MFLGEFSHTLDDKGRLTLPARLREELGEQVVVTRGPEKCLMVFRPADFQDFLNTINAAGSTASDVRGLSRYFSSKATEDTLDKQGRVNLPQNLRDYAHLDGEVTVIGAYDHVELWDPPAYARVDEELAQNVPDMSERVNKALQMMRQK